VQRTANRRFPFRIVIEQSGTILLELTLVSKPDPSYNAVPVEQEIREFALAWTGDPFATADFAARFPGIPIRRICCETGSSSIPFKSDHISVVGFGPKDVRRMIGDRFGWRFGRLSADICRARLSAAQRVLGRHRCRAVGGGYRDHRPDSTSIEPVFRSASLREATLQSAGLSGRSPRLFTRYPPPPLSNDA